ncbi:ABC transporter permease [Microbacterium sp. NPDC055910]|uniref:ABC transporter permease n=1 Tax=Microbacterium sp. NPDC055910 TaxID=3345659 RepID=UPI0035E3423E
MKAHIVLTRVLTALVAVFLVAPSLVLIPLSFTGKKSLAFPPDSWSLQWYENLFARPIWIDSIMTSLQVSLLVALLSLLLGVPAAFALARGGFPFTTAIYGIVIAPMIVPVMALAVGMFSLFLNWKLTGSVAGFVLAHTVLAVPFVVVTSSAAISGFDQNLERAASSLGASPLRVFLKITLPGIAGGVIAGGLFAFVTSFDETVIALFLQGPTARTLPATMYASVVNEVDPTMAAVATLLILATALVIGATFVPWRKKK